MILADKDLAVSDRPLSFHEGSFYTDLPGKPLAAAPPDCRNAHHIGCHPMTGHFWNRSRNSVFMGAAPS